MIWYIILIQSATNLPAALRLKHVGEARDEARVDSGCGDAEGRAEGENLRLRGGRRGILGHGVLLPSVPSFFWRGSEVHGEVRATLLPEALEVTGSGPNTVIKMILDVERSGLLRLSFFLAFSLSLSVSHVSLTANLLCCSTSDLL